MQFQLPKLSSQGFWVGVLSVGGILVGQNLGLLPLLEESAYRTLFRWRGERAWDPRIVLIEIDEPSLHQLGPLPWPRRRYAQLLDGLKSTHSERQPNLVVFNIVFSDASPEDDRLAIAMARHRFVILAQGWDGEQKPWLPAAPFRQAALGTGHALQPTQPSGLVQYVDRAHQQVPALSVVAQKAYSLLGPAAQTAPDRSLNPKSRPQRLWINWPGPIDRLPRYSFADVVAARIPPAMFEGRIVLVGVTAQGTSKISIPFESWGSATGVHFQAAALHTLLQNNGLQPLPWTWLLGIMVLGGPGLGVLLPDRAAGKQVGVALGLILGWWGLGLALLQGNVLIPIIWPTALILLNALGGLLLQYRSLKASNQEWEQLATIDDLTQVANRRYINQYLNREWQRLGRQQGRLSLVLCDIDYFKKYNDTYGHPAGDRCLQQVAQILGQGLKRPADILGRYGGEEFILILPHTSLEGAQQLAEGIRQQINALKLEHRSSLVGPHVTLSFGVASLVPAPLLEATTLIKAADQALYEAKRLGRNRVYVWDAR